MYDIHNAPLHNQMEDLFAKSIKLLHQNSIYNKVDKQLQDSTIQLYKYVYKNPNTKTNLFKLMRFVDDIDTSGFQKLYQLVQKLRFDYLTKQYRQSLWQIQKELQQQNNEQNYFIIAKQRSQKYADQLEVYSEKKIESNLKVLGLQQAKLRYQQVLQVLAQLQNAAQMLNQSNNSQTVLEQKYFHQEFSKMAKKLKVKFLQDKAGYDMDLHDTMLVQDMKSQIIQNDGFQNHKNLFIKCFGFEKFYTIFTKANLEFIDQQYIFYNQLPQDDLSEQDMYEYLFNLIKFISLFQYQLCEQEIQVEVKTQQYASFKQNQDDSTTTTTYQEYKLQPDLFAQQLIQNIDQIQSLCIKFITNIVQYFMNQKLLSIIAMERILILLTKSQLNIESFFQQLKDFDVEQKIEPKKMNFLQDSITKQITGLVNHSVEYFRQKLKRKFEVKFDSFDQWISVSASCEQFGQIKMMELTEIKQQVDPSFIAKIVNTVDKLKRNKEYSAAMLYIGFIYAYSYNEDILVHATNIKNNAQFIPTTPPEILEIQNIKVVPFYFYKTIAYINDFLSYIQSYQSDFDVKLIIGSTINCINLMIQQPSISLQNNKIDFKKQPFILDECLLISQIKLISIFAELVEYERQEFSHYLKVNYPDLITKYLPLSIQKMLKGQINLKCALRPHSEYATTATVTKMCRTIFDKFQYFSAIIQSFPRISGIIMTELFRMLEINLIDHYSYLTFNFNILEVVQQEVSFFQQTFAGMFSMEVFECIFDFAQLPVQPAVKFQQFREKYDYLFDPLKFKEVMMRMAGQNMVSKNECLGVTKEFKIK